METTKESSLIDDPQLVVGPMLLILRRLEKAEMIVGQLAARGVITPEEMTLAHLKSTLNHALRVIRVRQKTNKPTADIESAAETVRKSVNDLEQRLSPPV
jgi:hypothetical protein